MITHTSTAVTCTDFLRPRPSHRIITAPNEWKILWKWMKGNPPNNVPVKTRSSRRTQRCVCVRGRMNEPAPPPFPPPLHLFKFLPPFFRTGRPTLIHWAGAELTRPPQAATPTATGRRFSRMCGNVLRNIDSHQISDDVNYRHQRPALWRLFDFAPRRRRRRFVCRPIPMNGHVVMGTYRTSQWRWRWFAELGRGWTPLPSNGIFSKSSKLSTSDDLSQLSETRWRFNSLFHLFFIR